MTISTGILAALKKERELLDSAISALENIVRKAGGLDGSSRGRKRRKMSAAGRRRIAAAQRARWAKVRAKK